jgi:D-aspartate ligase
MVMGITKKAVILGVSDTGYGIIRSLAEAEENISIIGFEKGILVPEIYTRLCCKIYHYKNHEQLLGMLVDIGKNFSEKAVLFQSSDPLVLFCCENKKLLSNFYKFNLPDIDTVEILMEKQKFQKIAISLKCQTPKTEYLRNSHKIPSIIEHLDPPYIIKPYIKSKYWKDAGFEKAIIFNRKKACSDAIVKLQKIEKNLILQEFIPGKDNAVYFCLVYFDENSECLASFCGQKLRQWPRLVGDTASTIPYNSTDLVDETIRFFKAINYQGFGSMEYKKHSINNKFYMIEPTVGRADHQSYVSTANNVNIPLIAFESLNKKTKYKKNQKIDRNKSIMWIDEPHELLSILIQIKNINLKKLFSQYLMYNKKFRFFNLKDPLPFLMFIIFSIKKVFRFVKSVSDSN